jgi:hypothetical protein
MQFYANKDRLPLKTILFFALVLFIAYLPVSSFLFFLKNDAFTGYFPPKFFMSESIHSGHLPLWNPYINFGIPQYGDMSSGYWSPLTWLIASTVGYNAYTFTMEALLYILIGGLGMYKLTGSLQLNVAVRTMAAVAFMCSGYNVGHLQHFNWLSGAAFLPWCFWAYHSLLNSTSFKNIVKAVLLFYMLAASAHPGITISAFYFFLAYLIFFLFSKNEQQTIGQKLKQATKSHAIFIVLFLLLAAGMIMGYADILPHFSRSEKLSLADSLLNPTTLQSWISTAFPLSTVKNEAFFNTDISMRNSYFSITLLLFFLVGLLSKKTRLQQFLLFTGLFFFLLSTGGVFKTVAYKIIPFIGYVRLNGEFRLFAIFPFILFAAIELDKFIKQQKPFYGPVKILYYFIEIIVIGAIVFGLYKVFSVKESLFYHFADINTQQGFSSKLKALIDSTSFYDALWMQGLIQLFFLWGIKWAMRYRLWSLVKKIVVIDMVIACLLNVPFTGAGKASVATIQNVIDKSPKGIPIPNLVPINQYDSLPTAKKEMIGDWSFYGKQPGVSTLAAYPILLKTTQKYFDSSEAFHSPALNEKPFIITDPSPAKLVSFSPQEIVLLVKHNTGTTAVLQQNYYPHWYYTVTGKKKPVENYKAVFMSATLSKGEDLVRFTFEPGLVKLAMLVSLVSFVLLLTSLYMLYRRERKILRGKITVRT